jgi:phage tail sheath gpL-like
MDLRVVGAGLGRTGTASLKQALERLLGKPCYHMVEVHEHPEHADIWASAFAGSLPDWDRLFDSYQACVD